MNLNEDLKPNGIEEEVLEEEVKEDTPIETEEEEKVLEEETEIEEEQEEKPSKEQIDWEKKLQEEAEKARKDGYYNGLKQGINGVNPYTEQPIQDEYDLRVYEDMRELEKKGLDPIKDYPQFIVEKERNLSKAKLEEETKARESEERIKNEVMEFKKTFPKVDINELFKDKDFNELAEGLMGKLTITEIYNQYNKIESLAKKKQAIKDSVNETSVGSQESGRSEEDDLYTLEQIEKLSAKDYIANEEKILKSLKKQGIYY